MNHVNSWIIHESFMNRGYKYSWNLVHELWFMNISRICLDACIFKNNLPFVHEQFMNLSSWTKYDCHSWIVHEYSWIVHEYSSSHEFHFAWVVLPRLLSALSSYLHRFDSTEYFLTFFIFIGALSTGSRGNANKKLFTYLSMTFYLDSAWQRLVFLF